MYMRLERDNPIQAGAPWKEDVALQPQIKWQSKFFGVLAYFVQAFQFPMSKAGNDMNCYSHPNVINHAFSS